MYTKLRLLLADKDEIVVNIGYTNSIPEIYFISTRQWRCYIIPYLAINL